VHVPLLRATAHLGSSNSAKKRGQVIRAPRKARSRTSLAVPALNYILHRPGFIRIRIQAGTSVARSVSTMISIDQHARQMPRILRSSVRSFSAASACSLTHSGEFWSGVLL
jgi:hypothetical protein